MIQAVGDRAEVREILCIPAINFDSLDGFETSIVAYTTDVPAFGHELGQTVFAGPREYSRRAYERGACIQEGAPCGQGNLSADGEKASRGRMSMLEASGAKVMAR